MLLSRYPKLNERYQALVDSLLGAEQAVEHQLSRHILRQYFIANRIHDVILLKSSSCISVFSYIFEVVQTIRFKTV